MTECIDEFFNKENVSSGFFDNQIDKNAINYLVATNQIPYIRAGRRKILFSRKRLEEWVKERENVVVRYNK